MTQTGWADTETETQEDFMAQRPRSIIPDDNGGEQNRARQIISKRHHKIIQ